ncbi:MAG TPA: PepSY-like domain-containing protein [Bacteroidales bacterium]|nr:PepSY-like domain-containing protein [Bacteroidales bacterium]
MNKIAPKIVVIFCFIFMWISSLDLYSQKIKSNLVPEEVKQTLFDQQGEVKVSQWIVDGDIYIASFKVDGASAMAYIQSDGTFIRTATIIPKSTLPTAILDYLDRNYPEFRIDKAEIREEPEIPLHYYLEIKPEVLGAQPSILTFDNAGNFLTRQDPEGFETPELTPQQLVQQKADQELAQSNAPKGKTQQAPRTQKPTSTTKNEPKPKGVPKSNSEEESQFGDIPAHVQKAFSKKIIKPENLTWNSLSDFYVAECTFKDQKNELYFTKEGIWDKTYTFLPEEAITGPMLKHLNTQYKGFKFVSAVKETRADKQDKVLVEFYEKENAKTRVSTSIVFDKLGRILKTYKADEEQPSDFYAKLSKEAISKLPQDIPELAVEAFKLKYPKITGVEWVEDDEGYFLASYFGVRGREIVVMEGNGSMIEIRSEANKDNISSNISSYVKKNHRGYKISEYYSVRGLIEKKNYYLVVIKDKKTNMTTPLKFSLSGQIMP